MNRFFNWQVECGLSSETEHLSAPSLEAATRELPPVERAAAPPADLALHISAYVAAQRQKLSVLREHVPEVPVQAVADYSLGYGKQVFFGVYAAARKWQADDAGAMAASVAYYLALSLFPMLLLLTAGLGLVFRFTSLGHDAELQILSVVAEHCSPTLEQQVREVLATPRALTGRRPLRPGHGGAGSDRCLLSV